MITVLSCSSTGVSSSKTKNLSFVALFEPNSSFAETVRKMTL
jgi:hypothetical protein